MRISDWSSDVCSSDLAERHRRVEGICCRKCITGQIRPAKARQTLGPQRDHAVDVGLQRWRALIDLHPHPDIHPELAAQGGEARMHFRRRAARESACLRSEEHTSELQSLMRISYAVFCLKNTN